MRIPVEWIDVQPGDTVRVRGHRLLKRIECFGSEVTFDEDNRPHREATVALISDSGRRSWAFAAEILEKVEPS